MYEVEAKVQVRDAATAIRELSCAGFNLSPAVTQLDTIFARVEGDILNPATGTIVARIRAQREAATLTVKQDRSSELDCLEIETDISDPAAAKQILNLLGFRELIHVKKVRRIARQGVRVACVDVVDSLGCYVELEERFEVEPPFGIEDALFDELSSILSCIITRVEIGYDRLLLSSLRRK